MPARCRSVKRWASTPTLQFPLAKRPTRSGGTKAISALSQKCLDAQGIGCEAWEKEIDERVAALYGL